MKIGKYKHFKGKYYTVIAIALGKDDGKDYIVYRDNTGKYWVTTYTDWLQPISFEDQQKSNQRDRYQYVEDDNVRK